MPKDHMTPPRNYSVLKMLDPAAAKKHDEAMKKLEIAGHKDSKSGVSRMSSYELKKHLQEHELPHWGKGE